MIMTNSYVLQKGSGNNLKNSFSEAALKTRDQAGRDCNGESSYINLLQAEKIKEVDGFRCYR